jgi:hypothetical protein
MGVHQPDSSPMTSDGEVNGASPRGILKNCGSGEELMSHTNHKARESPLDGPLTDLWENLIQTKITEEKYVKKKQQGTVSSSTSWMTERAAAVGRASPMMWLSTKLSSARSSSSPSAQKQLFPDRSPSKVAQSRALSNVDGGAMSPAKSAAAAGQGGEGAEEESIKKKLKEAAARRGQSCSLVGERRFKLNNVEVVFLALPAAFSCSPIFLVPCCHVRATPSILRGAREFLASRRSKTTNEETKRRRAPVCTVQQSCIPAHVKLKVQEKMTLTRHAEGWDAQENMGDDRPRYAHAGRAVLRL